MQARVSERVGGELVAQEAAYDVLGVGDWVQGHSFGASVFMGRCLSYAQRQIASRGVTTCIACDVELYNVARYP